MTNSYSTRPNPGCTVSDVPSLPVTLSALITADGNTKLVAPGATVTSKMILPSVAVVGKLVKLNVVSAVTVRVW